MRKSRTTSTRLNLKLLLSGLLLVLLASFSPISLAASQADTLKQEPTINVPLSSWNELKGRLMKADASIENSTKSLEQAYNLTMTQGTALTELKIINEERTKELNALKAINEKQGQELAKASSKITEQEQRLNQASSSLMELKDEIKNNRRTEQRLRRQRDTWAISNAALFLAGVLRR